MTLFKHQQAIVDLSPARYLIAHGTGTGKSQTALSLADKNNVRAIIIVPKAIKRQWERLAPQHLVITKEEFRRDYVTLPRFEAVIVDEVHHFSGMKSQMSKALAKYLTAHNPRFVWLLTATPLTSTPWSIYRLAQFLGHKINYKDFEHKFFYIMKLGHRLILRPRDGVDQDLRALIHSLGSVVSLDDCVDVPEQTFETEYFPLSKGQIKAIKDLDCDTHIARFTAVHQIEQGCLKSDGYREDQLFPSLKNDRIIQLCKDNPKVLIFARYHLQIDQLKILLERELKCPVLTLTGLTKDRDEVVQTAERTPRCIVIAQSETSEGYQLPSFPLVIFASLSFSFLKYSQALGRVNRIDHLKKNIYIHLVTEGGPDEAIWQAVQKKQDFYIELFQFIS
jgi:superfamily II DNA or RNA helicase